MCVRAYKFDDTKRVMHTHLDAEHADKPYKISNSIRNACMSHG